MNVIRGKLDPNAFYAALQPALGHLFRGGAAGRLRLRRRGGVPQADRADRQGAARPGAAEEVQGGGRRGQDDRSTRQAPEQHVFARFGDTLPYGYMVCRLRWPALALAAGRQEDHGRARPGRRALHRARSRTMDDLIGGVVRAIAKGELAEVVAAIVAKTPAGCAARDLERSPRPRTTSRRWRRCEQGLPPPPPSSGSRRSGPRLQEPSSTRACSRARSCLEVAKWLQDELGHLEGCPARQREEDARALPRRP